MDKVNKWTDRKLNAMLKHLSAVYSREERQLNEILQKINEVIGQKAKTAYSAIVEANTDDDKSQAKKEYAQLVSREVAKNNKIVALIDDACEAAFKINQSAAEYANASAEEVFVRNYNAQTQEIASSVDGFTPHEASVEDVRDVGSAKSVQRVLNKKKDTRYTRNSIRTSFSVGAALGLPLKSIIKRSAKNAAKKNQTVAEEHAENVVLGVKNQAKTDAALRAEDEGFQTKKRWISTLDNRTRDSHVNLDGVIIDSSDEFLPGLKMPRDPNGRPEEVYNCRCEMAIMVGQAIGAERTARRGTVTGSYKQSKSFEGTETERVANMSYKEWAEWRKKQM